MKWEDSSYQKRGPLFSKRALHFLAFRRRFPVFRCRRTASVQLPL